MVDYLSKPFRWKYAPTDWQKRGLQETATGYGSRLTSSRMIKIEGEKLWRRVRVICFSNAGSAFIESKGQRLFLRDCDFSNDNEERGSNE